MTICVIIQTSKGRVDHPELADLLPQRQQIAPANALHLLLRIHGGWRLLSHVDYSSEPAVRERTTPALPEPVVYCTDSRAAVGTCAA